MKPRLTLIALSAGSILAHSVSLPASAHHKRWHNPPGHSKSGFSGGYSTLCKKLLKKRRNPPAWAPAWDYRAKSRIRYKRGGKYLCAEPVDLVRLPVKGLGNCNRNIIGAILGGAAGAAAGSQIGKGDGRTLATLGGTTLGALVGGNIGCAMVQVDQNCVGQILERTPNSPLKKALLTGFHSTAKHNATKAVSPSSETMRTI